MLASCTTLSNELQKLKMNKFFLKKKIKTRTLWRNCKIENFLEPSINFDIRNQHCIDKPIGS